MRRGFSLVELLISAAIIAIITTTVVIRFASFDSNVLLKSLAYEVAVSIRETQIYSVSVLGRGSEFRLPYGMSFTPGSQSYVFFSDISEDEPIPEYDAGEEVETFTIGRSMEIADVCVLNASGSEQCSISRLDISFMRPEFDALIHGEGYGGAVSGARIKISSPQGSAVWLVDVSVTGQISVNRE